MKQCVVIIPLYKDSPSKIEIASFRQGLSILKRYDISIITHTGVNLTEYLKIAKEVGKNFNIQYFDKNYFTSVYGYNRLCLSTSLYERFINYEYMLIYQTDAWVFKDELEYWCNKGYDYIGAPWFKTKDWKNFSHKFDSVGNGGFSLRRVKHCLEILTLNNEKKILTLQGLISLSNSIIDYLKVPIKYWGICNNIKYFVNKKKHYIYEDMLFSKYAKFSTFNCKIAECHDGMRFSFEANPSYLFKLNQNQLPFGCHAFEKFEYDIFWKKYISI